MDGLLAIEIQLHICNKHRKTIAFLYFVVANPTKDGTHLPSIRTDREHFAHRPARVFETAVGMFA